MAKSVASILEVNQTGIASDNNGGGFDAAFGGQDWTFGVSAQVVTFNGGGVTATCPSGSTVLTITGYTVTNNEKGNWLNITGGTNFTVGRYQVTASNTGSNTLTLHASPCPSSAGSAMTGVLGGPLASPGMAGAAKDASGQQAWFRGAFSISSATTNVSGGCIKDVVGGVSNGLGITSGLWQGYGTARGDSGKATLTLGASVANATVIQNNAALMHVRNFVFDGNNQTNAIGINTGNHASSEVHFCEAKNCTTGFSLSRGDEICSDLFGHHSATGFFTSVRYIRRAVAAYNTTGIASQGGVHRNVIAVSNTGIGIQLSNAGGVFDGVTIAKNGGAGLDVTSSGPLRSGMFANVLSAMNAGLQFTFETGRDYGYGDALAYYSGTGGGVSMGGLRVGNFGAGLIALASDPFVNSGATITSVADAFTYFALSPSSAAFASLKGAGFPSYLDIGAVQHQDSGAGGSSERSYWS